MGVVVRLVPSCVVGIDVVDVGGWWSVVGWEVVGERWEVKRTTERKGQTCHE